MCIILTRVWYSISSVVHPAPYAPVLILLLDSLSLHLLQFPFHSVSSCRIDHRNGSALHLTSLFWRSGNDTISKFLYGHKTVRNWKRIYLIINTFGHFLFYKCYYIPKEYYLYRFISTTKFISCLLPVDAFKILWQ